MKYKYFTTKKGNKLPYLEKIPQGWKELKDSMTAPLGFKWYYNGKSLFSKEFKADLIKINK